MKKFFLRIFDLSLFRFSFYHYAADQIWLKIQIQFGWLVKSELHSVSTSQLRARCRISNCFSFAFFPKKKFWYRSTIIPLKFCFIPNHYNQPFWFSFVFSEKKSGKTPFHRAGSTWFHVKMFSFQKVINQ